MNKRYIAALLFVLGGILLAAGYCFEKRRRYERVALETAVRLQAKVILPNSLTVINTFRFSLGRPEWLFDQCGFTSTLTPSGRKVIFEALFRQSWLDTKVAHVAIICTDHDPRFSGFAGAETIAKESTVRIWNISPSALLDGDPIDLKEIIPGSFE